jgi:pyruvate formate lyase activating enzyme
MLALALRNRRYMQASGGGVTASGGEPLLQIKPLLALFSALKREGIHTAIDTSGHGADKLPPILLDQLIESTDLFLLDIKAIDHATHMRLTGRHNAGILHFAQELSARGKPMWIRHVIVPGITDTPAELHSLARFANSLNNVEKRELLPYHSLGKYKWEKLGVLYPLEGMRDATAQDIERAQNIMGLIAPYPRA